VTLARTARRGGGTLSWLLQCGSSAPQLAVSAAAQVPAAAKCSLLSAHHDRKTLQLDVPRLPDVANPSAQAWHRVQARLQGPAGHVRSRPLVRRMYPLATRSLLPAACSPLSRRCLSLWIVNMWGHPGGYTEMRSCNHELIGKGYSYTQTHITRHSGLCAECTISAEGTPSCCTAKLYQFHHDVD
jgi:hypothetical protein